MDETKNENLIDESEAVRAEYVNVSADAEQEQDKRENEQVIDDIPAQEDENEQIIDEIPEPEDDEEDVGDEAIDAYADLAHFDEVFKDLFSEEPVKPKRSGKGIIALALVCALVGSMAGAGIMYALLNKNFAGAETGETARSISYAASRRLETVTVESAGKLSDVEIYNANVASTVGITSSVTTTNFWGYPTTSAASGSGFIYSENGYIITNYHVIEGSSAVSVSTYDGASYPAELVGFDKNSDIAVLKIEAEELVPVVLGNSEELAIGDHVVAIGNPLGELTFSLTQGAVSSLNRSVTFSTGTAMQLIQTDCAINSGNSGGALFNDRGEVIGITNAKYSSSSYGASIDNIGFAIPIDHVSGIIKSIIETGYVSKPYIGVTVATVTEEAQQFGLPAGAAIQDVTEGSPADEAGLQKNDIITEVNGVSISAHSDLVIMVQSGAPGDELVFTVYRSGETLELTVTLGETRRSALEE